MKLYVNPEVELFELEIKDILMASGNIGGGGIGGGGIGGGDIGGGGSGSDSDDGYHGIVDGGGL